MSMYVLFILARALIVSFAGAKVRRFFNSANFLATFFEVFLRKMVKWLEISSYREEVFLIKNVVYAQYSLLSLYEVY